MPLVEDVVDVPGIPRDRRLGRPVEVPLEHLAFVTEHALADVLAPDCLNSGVLVDIFQQREEDFGDLSRLEVTYRESQNGHKVRETLFVSELMPNSKPRVCMSLDALKAMHRAIAVLTRKTDNTLMTLKSCREDYLKEITHLRRCRETTEHDVQFFNPYLYQDQFTQEQVSYQLEATATEMQDIIDQKEKELIRLKNKLAVMEPTKDELEDDVTRLKKCVWSMPLDQVMHILKQSVGNRPAREALLYSTMEQLLETKGRSGAAPKPNAILSDGKERLSARLRLSSDSTSPEPFQGGTPSRVEVLYKEQVEQIADYKQQIEDLKSNLSQTFAEVASEKQQRNRHISGYLPGGRARASDVTRIFQDSLPGGRSSQMHQLRCAEEKKRENEWKRVVATMQAQTETLGTEVKEQQSKNAELAEEIKILLKTLESQEVTVHNLKLESGASLKKRNSQAPQREVKTPTRSKPQKLPKVTRSLTTKTSALRKSVAGSGVSEGDGQSNSEGDVKGGHEGEGVHFEVLDGDAFSIKSTKSRSSRASSERSRTPALRKQTKSLVKQATKESQDADVSCGSLLKSSVDIADQPCSVSPDVILTPRERWKKTATTMMFVSKVIHGWSEADAVESSPKAKEADEEALFLWTTSGIDWAMSQKVFVVLPEIGEPLSESQHLQVRITGMSTAFGVEAGYFEKEGAGPEPVWASKRDQKPDEIEDIAFTWAADGISWALLSGAFTALPELGSEVTEEQLEVIRAQGGLKQGALTRYAWTSEGLEWAEQVASFLGLRPRRKSLLTKEQLKVILDLGGTPAGCLIPEIDHNKEALAWTEQGVEWAQYYGGEHLGVPQVGSEITDAQIEVIVTMPHPSRNCFRRTSKNDGSEGYSWKETGVKWAKSSGSFVVLPEVDSPATKLELDLVRSLHGCPPGCLANTRVAVDRDQESLSPKSQVSVWTNEGVAWASTQLQCVERPVTDSRVTEGQFSDIHRFGALPPGSICQPGKDWKPADDDTTVAEHCEEPEPECSEAEQGEKSMSPSNRSKNLPDLYGRLTQAADMAPVMATINVRAKGSAVGQRRGAMKPAQSNSPASHANVDFEKQDVGSTTIESNTIGCQTMISFDAALCTWCCVAEVCDGNSGSKLASDADHMGWSPVHKSSSSIEAPSATSRNSTDRVISVATRSVISEEGSCFGDMASAIVEGVELESQVASTEQVIAVDSRCVVSSECSGDGTGAELRIFNCYGDGSGVEEELFQWCTKYVSSDRQVYPLHGGEAVLEGEIASQACDTVVEEAGAVPSSTKIVRRDRRLLSEDFVKQALPHSVLTNMSAIIQRPSGHGPWYSKTAQGGVSSRNAATIIHGRKRHSSLESQQDPEDPQIYPDISYAIRPASAAR